MRAIKLLSLCCASLLIALSGCAKKAMPTPKPLWTDSGWICPDGFSLRYEFRVVLRNEVVCEPVNVMHERLLRDVEEYQPVGALPTSDACANPNFTVEDDCLRDTSFPQMPPPTPATKRGQPVPACIQKWSDGTQTVAECPNPKSIPAKTTCTVTELSPTLERVECHVRPAEQPK